MLIVLSFDFSLLPCQRCGYYSALGGSGRQSQPVATALLLYLNIYCRFLWLNSETILYGEKLIALETLTSFSFGSFTRINILLEIFYHYFDYILNWYYLSINQL